MTDTRKRSSTAHFLTSFECPNYFAGGIWKACTVSGSRYNPLLIAANSHGLTLRRIKNGVPQNLYAKLISYLSENTVCLHSKKTNMLIFCKQSRPNWCLLRYTKGIHAFCGKIQNFSVLQGGGGYFYLPPGFKRLILCCNGQRDRKKK